MAVDLIVCKAQLAGKRREQGASEIRLCHQQALNLRRTHHGRHLSDPAAHFKGNYGNLLSRP